MTPKPMWEREREAIVEALEWAGGDVLRAAVALEISPQTIYRRVRERDISLGPWRKTKVRSVGA